MYTREDERRGQGEGKGKDFSLSLIYRSPGSILIESIKQLLWSKLCANVKVDYPFCRYIARFEFIHDPIIFLYVAIFHKLSEIQVKKKEKYYYWYILEIKSKIKFYIRNLNANR